MGLFRIQQLKKLLEDSTSDEDESSSSSSGKEKRKKKKKKEKHKKRKKEKKKKKKRKHKASKSSESSDSEWQLMQILKFTRRPKNRAALRATDRTRRNTWHSCGFSPSGTTWPPQGRRAPWCGCQQHLCSLPGGHLCLIALIGHQQGRWWRLRKHPRVLPAFALHGVAAQFPWTQACPCLWFRIIKVHDLFFKYSHY